MRRCAVDDITKEYPLQNAGEDCDATENHFYQGYPAPLEVDISDKLRAYFRIQPRFGCRRLIIYNLPPVIKADAVARRYFLQFVSPPPR